MKLFRSLYFRLIASYIVLALLLLLISGFVFSNALSSYADSVQREQIEVCLKQAMRLLEDAKTRGLSRKQTLLFLRRNLPGIRIGMENPMALGKQRDVIFRVNGTKNLQPSGKRSQVMIFLKNKAAAGSFVLPGNEEFPPNFYRFTIRSSNLAVLSDLYRRVLIILTLIFALAGLIGWLLSRWLARPLSSLTGGINAVALGNFQETVGQTGIIELDRLGYQFNQMVLRLKEFFQALTAARDTAQHFAADAAHELKTPVTTLRAYYEITLEHPERLKQVLPAFRRQIERMEQIIAGLLQIASLSKDIGTIFRPVDLCTAIRALEPLYQSLIEETGHNLTVNCPAHPVPVMLDQGLLEIALNNLLDNACKYTPPGGRISVTLEVGRYEAIIAVKDTGKGIPLEELPYIFERFHRGVDTQSLPGTGLGLAIAREVILRLGGTIKAESTVGQGSAFIIHLPLRDISIQHKNTVDCR